MGEQSALQQTGPALATHQAALRLIFHDGVCTSYRIYTQNTHIQARLSATTILVCKYIYT